MNFTPRLILPAIGVAVFLLAYLAQNVWNLFHIEDITRAIRDLPYGGLLVGMALLGFVEATIVLCFYLPGTAIVILLLLGMQPSLADAVPLLAALTAGTMLGYGLSLILGVLLQQRLPALVGENYFHKVQSLIARYGLLAFIPSAFHPNQLALAFAILGYFRTRRLGRYFLVAAVAQTVWWGLYLSAAELIAGQTLVSNSNFQLYVAALFSVWFAYELFAPRRAQVP
jgi:membrane protein DedA with SNARE-associated domain